MRRRGSRRARRRNSVGFEGRCGLSGPVVPWRPPAARAPGKHGRISQPTHVRVTAEARRYDTTMIRYYRQRITLLPLLISF